MLETKRISIDQNFQPTLKELMRCEKNRLDSFPSRWLSNQQLDINVVQDLAKAGFYYKPIGGTQCFSCGWYKPVAFWVEGHDPEAVHRSRRPNCEFLQEKRSNAPMDKEQHPNDGIAPKGSTSHALRSEKPPRPKVWNLKQSDKFRTNPQNYLHEGQMQSQQEADSEGNKLHRNPEVETRVIPRRPPAPRKPDVTQNSSAKPLKDNISSSSKSTGVTVNPKGNATVRQEPTGGNSTRYTPSDTNAKEGKSCDQTPTSVTTVSAAGRVKAMVAVDACEILQSLIHDHQEHAHETERKLLVLRDAVYYNNTPGPHPVPTNSATTREQQTMCTQRDVLMMPMAPPATESIQQADETVTEHHKILMKIASVITLPEELNRLGIWLGCDPNDVIRLQTGNWDIKDAAYRILRSFYASVPNAERWGKLMEALEELNQQGIVKEQRLEELHHKAKS